MSAPDQSQQPQTDPRQPADQVETPPRTISGILRRLGPGLIIAASIVGSGELIATTKTGALAGFWLLWLIIIGCVIKVFVQVEFGRYAISSGVATMAALDEVPGPRIRNTNWVLWYWLIMFVVSLAQLGGIVGGVGQSMAISMPITGDFQELLDRQNAWDAAAAEELKNLPEADVKRLRSRDAGVRAAARGEVKKLLEERIGSARPSVKESPTWDDITWAAVVTAVTIVILVVGRYALVQNLSAVLVASFTAVTIFCVFALQKTDYAIGWGDVWDGCQFKLPRWEDVTRSLLGIVKGERLSPLAAALAAFGIIGVGANEVITYPYWCLEKGYARFTGPRQQTPEWADRARGWMRVMRWDAGLSMVIYTFATVAFFILGAAVLHRDGSDPEGNQMVYALSQPYVKVFGDWAHWVFLFGAFAVLYSTFFVANAGHALVATDALRVFRLRAHNERARRWWIRAFCVLFPLTALGFCVFIRHPVMLVLASGVMQAIMLPMLAGATLYFRYYRYDRRILPGRLWDLLLWISALGLLVAGAWTGWTALAEIVKRMS